MKNQLSLSQWGVVASVAAAFLLSACFGGDDNNSTPAATSQVPDSASATVVGFIAYLAALVVSDADTLEPVDTSSVTPPTDDTSEPVAIN